MADKTESKMKYKVLVGMNYGPLNTRAEPGDVVDDLPQKSVGWLLRDGAIEKIEE